MPRNWKSEGLIVWEEDTMHELRRTGMIVTAAAKA
jgi:hypothetical protein